MRHKFIPIAFLAVLAWGPVFPEPSSPPRLVVVVVIDQFRTDYLYRFSEHYLPPRDGERMGGIRFLMEEGAVYRNARYLHQNTSTGPGHATILTGGPPSRTGIVGNWWMDRKKEYRSAFANIRRDTVLLRKRMTERALKSLDPQDLYAVDSYSAT